MDLSAGMVAETQREITARAILNARVMQMDAEHLRFADVRFDIVLSGFALFFFPQLDQALAEIRRVLAPGGQVVVSTWGSTQDKRWEWLGKLFETYIPPEPEEAAKTQQAGPDFGTPDGLKAILAGGGFHNLRAESETEAMMYRSEEEWWSVRWSHGGRLGLEELERTRGTATLELFKASAFEHLQTFKTPDGIPERMEVLFAAGKKE